MKTFTATPEDIHHDWHVVDATGVPLGRLASAVAQLIRGKHKPTFTPHMDGGDFVVVVNAEQVKLTGRKLTNKMYFRHTGYMGHERFTSALPPGSEEITLDTLKQESVRTNLRQWAYSTLAWML